MLRSATRSAAPPDRAGLLRRLVRLRVQGPAGRSSPRAAARIQPRATAAGARALCRILLQRSLAEALAVTRARALRRRHGAARGTPTPRASTATAPTVAGAIGLPPPRSRTARPSSRSVTLTQRLPRSERPRGAQRGDAPRWSSVSEPGRWCACTTASPCRARVSQPLSGQADGRRPISSATARLPQKRPSASPAASDAGAEDR